MEKNELIINQENQVSVRDIYSITTEILVLKEQFKNSALLYYIEIGKD